MINFNRIAFIITFWQITPLSSYLHLCFFSLNLMVTLLNRYGSFFRSAKIYIISGPLHTHKKCLSTGLFYLHDGTIAHFGLQCLNGNNPENLNS